MPEYGQKTSAVNQNIYGALAGQKGSNPRHAVLEWMWEKHERTYNGLLSARLRRLCF
jgi:hypothetical protein